MNCNLEHFSFCILEHVDLSHHPLQIIIFALLFPVAPRVISAPSPQELVLDTNGRIDCLVTGGARTVDWWKNRILIASSSSMGMSGRVQ